MKSRLFAVLATIVLAGCANDRYVVIPGGPGSQTQMASALRTCKHDVLYRYAQQQYRGGAIVGALLAGPLGAAVGRDANAQPDDMKSSDIDPAIERCMKERGYDGTSEN